MTYIPRELQDVTDDLQVKEKAKSVIDEFQQRFMPPPPPQVELPKLDVEGMLAPFKQQVQQQMEPVTQAVGGMGDSIGSMIDGYKRQVMGSVPQADPSMPSNGVQPVMRGPVSAPVAPDAPVTRETVTQAAATALSRAGLPVEMAPYVAGIAINEGILQPGTIARDHWSVGGVKAPGSAGVVTVPTREVINGQSVMQEASFGKFNSMQEGMDSLATFIRDSPRFGPVAKQAAQTGDYAGMIEGFRQNGYATDPNWTKQVNSIASGLPVPSAATAMPAAGQSTSGAFDANSISKQWEGQPYVFGGGRDGTGQGVPGSATDCSGFVSAVFRERGISLPAHTDAAYNTLQQRGQRVDPKDAQPGDVVFYMGAGTGGAITHHMGLYAGPGKVLDMSVANGGGVKERPIGHAGEYVIMRDPRLNPPVPPQREEQAPPIVPTGIAEQTGGQKIKGFASVEQAMASDRGFAMQVEAGDLDRGPNATTQYPAIREDVSGAYPALTPQFDDPAGDIRGSGSISDQYPTMTQDERDAEEQRNPNILSKFSRGTMAMEDLYAGRMGSGTDPTGRDETGIPQRGGDNSLPTAGRDIRGDYAPAAQPAGPAVPYGVAGNVEPGDFEIPGRPLAGSGNAPSSISSGFGLDSQALETALPPQNDGAVEPPAVPSEAGQAPASSGNPIVDFIDNIAAQAKTLFGGQKPDLAQGAADIQARTTTTPTGPMPFDAVGAEMERAGIPALITEYQDAIRSGDVQGALRAQREATNRIAMALPNVRNQILDAVAEPLGLDREGPLSLPNPAGRLMGDENARIGVADVVGNLAGGPGSFNPAIDTAAAIAGTREGDLASSIPLAIWAGGQIVPEVARALTPKLRDAIERLPNRSGNVTPDDVARIAERIDEPIPSWLAPDTAGQRVAIPEGFDNPKPPPRPTFENSAITPNVLPAAKGAVEGAVAGGYSASQEENATPQSVATGALQGAGVGAVRGALGSAAKRGLGRPQSDPAIDGAASRATNQPPGQQWEPTWDSPYADQPEQRPISRTEGLNPVERQRRNFVRAWTDDRVDLAEVQRAAQEEIGRPLTAPEMVTELSRRNPLAAAEVAVKSGPFRDAVQSVGDDTDLLDQVLTYRDMMDVSRATGNPNRRFSGGLRVQDAEQRLDALRTNLDPARWQRLENAANRINNWVDEYRQRMLDAGVWSDDLTAQLRELYPNYVPTRIMDYMRDPDNIAVGKSLSLRDRGLRALTDEGTERAREQPLASLIRYAAEAETIIHKNQVYNAFVNLANQAPDAVPLRQVPNGYTRVRGEELITGFENGVRTTYATTAPIAAAIRMEAGTQIPIARAATGLFRETITRSPIFVAGQVPLDATSYMVRETARENGNVIGVATELVRAYRDAFRGLGSGRVEGDLYRAIREGGGMAGIHDRTARAMATKLDDVTRRNMLEIHNAGDVGRLLKWAATFEWSQAVGQRVEMAPRLAAARLGEARALREGANVDTAALRGVMDFRDVTLDFQRGGTWARTLNQMVPFFNVGWQSAATVQRAWRENPRAFPLTAMALIGAPTAAAEAWNRSDPQRAKDYEDVPDYVKDRGIVFMLPGAESTDAQGNRRPNYALVPLRELAPFAILAREATAKAVGEDTRGADALLGAGVSAVSPVQANNPADFFNTFSPFGISTGLQLATNRDMFRDRDIATERNDQESAAFSKALAEKLGVRPSQVEFAIRDLTGYAGSSALALSDMATGNQKPGAGGVQDTPFVGGLIKRFVGNSIGQDLQDARDSMLSEPVKAAIKEAGMRDEQLSGVRGEIEGLKLSRAEQTRYQEAFNRVVEREVATVRKLPAWKNATTAEREAELRLIFSEARQAAQADALKGVKQTDIDKRFRMQDKKAS